MGRVLTADAMYTHDTFDPPDEVALRAFETAAPTPECISFTMPAKRIPALRFE